MNLEEIIEAIQSTSENLANLSPEKCIELHDDLYMKLYNLAGNSTYLDLNNQKTIDEKILAAFNARIAMKDSLKALPVNSACLKNITDVFRGLRYVEDYLIELRMVKNVSAPTEYKSLTGEFPFLMVNPKFAQEFKSPEDIKSGDILLTRGNAFSSAAIARIGTNDYQFSHLGFAYRDPETKELKTTEAYIEIGSIVQSIDEHFERKNSREAVFRYHDPEVAHKASAFIHDRVLKAQNENKLIEYDFSMNFKENSKLFCTELISSGFKHALPDADYFPLFKTKFSTGMIPFLNSIGLPVTNENIKDAEVFAPGDIQFDPRFELVAEWRNPLKLEESRLKDFILTALFERMDRENYRFDASVKMELQAKTLWLLRRVPIVKKFLKKKLTLTIGPDQIELFMVVDQVGEAIYKEVEKASLEYDRPMTPKEIYGVIDVFFKQDFELYKRYKKGQDVTKPAFHKLFHP